MGEPNRVLEEHFKARRRTEVEVQLRQTLAATFASLVATDLWTPGECLRVYEKQNDLVMDHLAKRLGK